MDIKVEGITAGDHAKALDAGARGRLFILGKMEAIISAPRTEMSPLRAADHQIKINPEKIGDVIGPGGKMIRKINEETKSTIDIEDDGTVFIGSNNAENAQKAIDWIRDADARGRGRRDLHRQGDPHHGLRRLRRDPARQGRPGPHLRAGRLPRADRSRTWSTSATR